MIAPWRALCPLPLLRDWSEAGGTLLAGARVAACVAVVIMVLSLSHLFETFGGRSALFYLNTAVRPTAPLQIVNTYGLFAVMTTQRIEIVLEADSRTAKIGSPMSSSTSLGDVNLRASKPVAPYQPRLDWANVVRGTQ